MTDHSILKVTINEFIHADGMYWLHRNCSFFEIKKLMNIFCRYGNITGDDLWDIYNSENREYITNIPLLKEFIKDCQSDGEIESMIRGLSEL